MIPGRYQVVRSGRARLRGAWDQAAMHIATAEARRLPSSVIRASRIPQESLEGVAVASASFTNSEVRELSKSDPPARTATRRETGRNPPEEQKRRSGALVRRLQNRHALHMRRHRKDVGLGESRKTPGQTPISQLTILRGGPGASNERHSRQSVNRPPKCPPGPATGAVPHGSRCTASPRSRGRSRCVPPRWARRCPVPWWACAGDLAPSWCTLVTPPNYRPAAAGPGSLWAPCPGATCPAIATPEKIGDLILMRSDRPDRTPSVRPGP